MKKNIDTKHLYFLAIHSLFFATLTLDFLFI
jgi:hypothetical protein